MEISEEMVFPYEYAEYCLFPKARVKAGVRGVCSRFRNREESRMPISLEMLDRDASWEGE